MRKSKKNLLCKGMMETSQVPYEVLFKQHNLCPNMGGLASWMTTSRLLQHVPNFHYLKMIFFLEKGACSFFLFISSVFGFLLVFFLTPHSGCKYHTRFPKKLNKNLPSEERPRVVKNKWKKIKKEIRPNSTFPQTFAQQPIDG